MAEPSKAYSEATPALNIILGITLPDHPHGWPDVQNDGRPWECPGCPFAKLSEGERLEDIKHDVAEAHYDCSLLSDRVWGEDPKCKREDWQRRAQEEIGATNEASRRRSSSDDQHPGFPLGDYSNPDVKIVEDLAKGVYGQVEWRFDREEGQHVFERGYIGNQLVALRCNRCGLTPLSVTRKDLSIEVCRLP